MALHSAPKADSCRSDYTIISDVTVLLRSLFLGKCNFPRVHGNINNFRLSCISCDESSMSLDI